MINIIIIKMTEDLKSSFEMFCVYHKKYYPREDNSYFTFFGVNEVYPKEKKDNNILEYELDRYNPFLQKRGYMETSAYLHVYWNNLHANKDMIGFSQYDMKHNQTYDKLDKKTIYLLNTNKKIVKNGKWNSLMFPKLCNLNFLIKSYNSHFNKEYSIKDLENQPLSLLQTNIYPVAIYKKLCGWLEKLVDEIYPWSNQPPYQTHFGSIGGYTERALSIFNAFEIYEGIPYSNLNIQHGVGAEVKEQYNHKSFLNNYNQDVHCKIVEETDDTKDYCIVGIKKEENMIIKENINDITKLFFIDKQGNKTKPLMIIGNCSDNTFKWKHNILDCNLDDYEILYKKVGYNTYDIILTKLINKNIKKFTKIYETSLWGNNNNKFYKGSSGDGSWVKNNTKYIDFLKKFIKDNNIRKVSDLGCGDFLCGEIIYNNLDVSYNGYDAYKKLIDYHTSKFSSTTKFRFHHLDLIKDKSEIESGDLCIIKDMLQHLDNEEIYILMDYLYNSNKFKYILIVNCCHQKTNNQILDNNNFRPLNSKLLPLKKYNPIHLFNIKTKEYVLLKPLEIYPGDHPKLKLENKGIYLNLQKEFMQKSISNIKMNDVPFQDGKNGIRYRTVDFGEENYKLFLSISEQLPNNSRIMDIGTCRGNSAVSLSYSMKTQNKTLFIDTYDIKKMINPICEKFFKEYNVNYHIYNILENLDKNRDKILSTDLIFFDIDPHEGINEYNFYLWLKKNNYQGIIIFDDIDLGIGHSCGTGYRNTKYSMKDFWKKIPEEEKIDITSVGHHSGTGIIYFNKKHDILYD